VKAFTSTTGRVAVIDRPDIDTDQIIPKPFLKRIERTGYGEFLFYDWRLDENGRPRPEFELNDPAFAGASILLTGRNFGCGSSREHAAWALEDYGFDVVIAPSFGDIFRTNASKIGLVTIALPAAEVKRLIGLVDPVEGAEMSVDLEQCTITDPQGQTLEFEFDQATRTWLLHGLDEIALTLQHEGAITAYEEAHGIA
jgi:3-isopropylmalate/(R)-2-methylmalate dehydratase small subunit